MTEEELTTLANSLVAKPRGVNKSDSSKKFRCAVCKEYLHRREMAVAPRRDHSEGVVLWCVCCMLRYVPALNTWFYTPLFEDREQIKHVRPILVSQANVKAYTRAKPAP